MSGDKLPDIRELSFPDLQRFFQENNEKSFHARQVYDWLWKKACHSFNEMTDLSKSARKLLTDHFSFNTAVPEIIQKSSDGTIKAGFRLYDGLMIEGVLIPAAGRMTACISSQVGCALACRFCATGRLGFTRNLTAGEIFDQVTHLSYLSSSVNTKKISDPLNGKHQTDRSISPQVSNIVYMGMGEPFLNYESVVESVEKITSGDGLGISPQRITISSIGIPRMIRKMADDNPKYHFAISLHTAIEEKRNRIIPFNIQHPLNEITDALKYYKSVTGKRFTIEYIMIGDFNDSISDAAALAQFCRSFPVKINIIEYNQVMHSDFRRADPVKTKKFIQFLESRNLVVNLRKSRGNDIDGACGQLSLKWEVSDNGKG